MPLDAARSACLEFNRTHSQAVQLTAMFSLRSWAGRADLMQRNVGPKGAPCAFRLPGRTLRLSRYPLIPVSAMPSMKVRCAMRNSAIVGSMVKVEAAIINCHCAPYMFWNIFKPREMVHCSWFVR